MSWYCAKLLLKAYLGSDSITETMKDESIRLISASSIEEAQQLALEVGHTLEHSYPNDKGETVYWKFISVMEIQDLCEDTLQHGMEVFSELSKLDKKL